MGKQQSPPDLKKMSWWTLLMTVRHARRNNRKSHSDWAYGRLSSYARCDEIYFYEDLMFRIFLEMYQRLFDRPYQVKTKYDSGKYSGH